MLNCQVVERLKNTVGWVAGLRFLCVVHVNDHLLLGSIHRSVGRKYGFLFWSVITRVASEAKRAGRNEVERVCGGEGDVPSASW